jgi:hypothetical protein
MDDDVQIEVDGDVVGEVPGEDDEDGPVMETAQTRTDCCATRRRPVCGACSRAAWLMKMAGAGRR